MSCRRMFSPLITDSDAFLEMPSSAQNYYFHLGMRADDDGFVSNPKKVLRMINGADDDLKLLIAKRFILTFENGVIVIKHWRMNNLIRKDWYRPTIYKEEMKSLTIKENGAYTENLSIEKELLVNENATSRHRRLGKVRLGKVSLGEGDTDFDRKEAPDNGFEEVWNAYNNKKGRMDAERAWSKVKRTPEFRKMLLEDFKKRAMGRQWQDGFKPHLATYLNGERWKDDIEQPRRVCSPLPVGTPQIKGKYDNEKEITA